MNANGSTNVPVPSPNEAALERYCRYLEREYTSFVSSLADMLDSVEVWRRNAGPEEATRWAVLQRSVDRVLVQHGIRPTARQGQPVDLRCHEVVAMTPDESAAADTVVQIIQMGYEMVLPGIGPICLRPSKVVLSSGAAAEPAEPKKNSCDEGAIHG
ncbi:MAG: nucleotide exchange factor GrpE [Terracidiphilus sp.]